MKLLHLLYDFCNLYGDYGNILALERMLAEKSETDLVCISPQQLSEKLDLLQYDFIFIGSATEKNQREALEMLRVYKDPLAEVINSGTVVLATGNSFEIFGKSITDSEGDTVDGLGIFDFCVNQFNERIVTDQRAIFAETNLSVTGFVNKCSEIYGIDNPMFEVIEGVGNSKEDKKEGIIKGSFYGTHLIGPLLIKNPELTRYFADIILHRAESKQNI